MLISLVLTWQLVFTLPTHLVNGDTLVDYSHVELYKHNQSPTWVAMHVAMQMDSTVWNHFWPMVRMEAEPIYMNSYISSPIVLPDTLPIPYFYFLKVVRKTGAISVPSNEVTR